MNGRKVFKKYKPIFNVLSKILTVSPSPVREFLWDISSVFGNKISIGIKYSLLKSVAKSIGDNVYIGKYVIIKNAHEMHIGNNVSIHDYCYIDAAGGLTIGDNVSIAHNCSILTTNHQWNDSTKPIKYNNESFEYVKINDDVWLGCNVRVLAGVTISNRTVLAAGSIVNKDVASNSLYGGIPAKLIKQL